MPDKELIPIPGSENWVPMSEEQADMAIFTAMTKAGGGVPQEIVNKLKKVLTEKQTIEPPPPPDELQIVRAPRGMGKTTRALQWFDNTPNALLIVHSEHEAERLGDIYREKDQYAKAARIASYTTYRSHGPDTRGRTANQIGIDNLDLFFSGYFHHPVTFATITKPVVLKEFK